MALARVGETIDQCEKRYGKPVGSSSAGVVYLSGEIVVQIIYEKGKAEFIFYLMSDKSQVDDAIIKSIMYKYTKKWSFLSRDIWVSEKFAATYNDDTNCLFITHKGNIEMRKFMFNLKADGLTKGL